MPFLCFDFRDNLSKVSGIYESFSFCHQYLCFAFVLKITVQISRNKIQNCIESPSLKIRFIDLLAQLNTNSNHKCHQGIRKCS